MKTHKMPVEPDESVRLLVPGSESAVWWHSGGYCGDWTNGVEELSWSDLLQEYEQVHELETPTEAVEFVRKYGCDVSRLYHQAPAIQVDKHLKDIVEFVEAFK